jgi:hypothetical protein
MLLQRSEIQVRAKDGRMGQRDSADWGQRGEIDEKPLPNYRWMVPLYWIRAAPAREANWHDRSDVTA